MQKLFGDNLEIKQYFSGVVAFNMVYVVLYFNFTL